MNKSIIRSLALLLILVLAFASIPALAEKAQIRLGGKMGLMYTGDSVTLRPKLTGVQKSELKWSSSDESVATVSGGTIVGKAPGRAVISVSGGGAQARCGVVVLPKSVELKVGESGQLPNGTLEKYAVQNGKIASIGKRGLVTAKAAGETLIGVRYGAQMLLIQLKVTSDSQEEQEKPDSQQSAAAELDCADSASQIVLVEYDSGSKARLSVHEKQSGLWKEIYSCTAYVGKNGIGKTKEGDQKTPTGTFNLTQPFGIKGDPGANMPYTQVTKYHYWCGTSGSEYYNQLVDMRNIDRECTSSDEYLIDYKGVYNYCMFIDYNKDGEAGKGSCIFLHCLGSKKSTAGCIAIEEAAMKQIIRWAQPGAKIVIR